MTHETNLSNKDAKVGIVLLAAGASSRMGTPKQLLKLQGVSLVRRAAGHALDSGCEPVVVVLGANAEMIASELNGLAVSIAVNREWAAGMSSSIRCGLQALLALDPHLKAVILFLGDQPNVTRNSLQRLTTAHVQSGSALVAASYSGRIGTPAFFSRVFFDELSQLDGQGGAKSFLERHAAGVLAIDIPEAAWDLDTPEDVANFGNGQELSLQVRHPI